MNNTQYQKDTESEVLSVTTTTPINDLVVTTTSLKQEVNKSILPSIAESERFIKFLSNRFNYPIPNDLIVLIHETNPNIRGYFRSVRCAKIWKLNDMSFKQQEKQQEQEKQKPLNSIVLSSHELKDEPYQVLAHEFAHYINFILNVKDCSRNGKYHNTKFKERAEEFLLRVEKDKRLGFAFTYESDAFKKMLNEEFKPTQDAFKIFQEIDDSKKKKSNSRMLKFMCGCGCIVRSAKNEDMPLNAICQYCNTKFEVEE